MNATQMEEKVYCLACDDMVTLPHPHICVAKVPTDAELEAMKPLADAAMKRLTRGRRRSNLKPSDGSKE